MIGPAVHPGLEEGSIDDELSPAFEHVQQADCAGWSFKGVVSLDRHPGHPPPFGSKRVAGAGMSLLLHQKLEACSLPFLWRDNRRGFHRNGSFHAACASIRFI